MEISHIDISSIDPNFKLSTVNDPNVVWYELSDPAFSLHGIFYDKDSDMYVRMPRNVSETVSPGVHYLNGMTSGGRVRFSTNSPYVAVQCVGVDFGPMNHMPLTGSHGLSLYADGIYRSMYVPTNEVIFNALHAKSNAFVFDGLRPLPDDGAIKNCVLHFPLYGGVRKLLIGLKKGSTLQTAPAYKQPVPVVFYGNSITQGGCASHAGNEYAALLSQWLDFDFVNLGFSGNGKGEPTMAQYLASLDASAYVLDYDWNAPTPEYLAETHYPLYETIRKAHKDTPIVLLTNSDGHYYPEAAAKRRAIIYETYCKAKANGDNKIWFIGGETLLGTFGKTSCAVDTCHPNDLGFFRMAEAIAPVLKAALNLF